MNFPSILEGTYNNPIVFDAEANNLMPYVTKAWIISIYNLVTLESSSFYGPGGIEKGLNYLSQSDLLIGHNILGFDLPMFKKLYGWEYHGQTIDTLRLSQMLWPDRTIPKGAKGPHSVEAWGIRLGLSKPKHEEWDRFSEEMIVRCEADVKIQTKILNALIKESEQELPYELYN